MAGYDPETTPPRTARQLVAFRRRHSLSQTRLGELVNASQKAISRSEKGHGRTVLPKAWVMALGEWLDTGGAPDADTKPRFHVPKRGRGLRRLRTSFGLGVSELADELEIPRAVLVRLEGRRRDLALTDEVREAIRTWLLDLHARACGLTVAVPKTGEDLRRLTEEFAREPDGMTLSEFADGLSITLTELVLLFGAEHLPGSIREELKKGLAWNRNMFSIPTSGNGLRKLIAELEDQFEISGSSLAAAVGLQTASLKQYTYLRRLPRKFRESLRSWIGSEEFRSLVLGPDPLARDPFAVRRHGARRASRTDLSYAEAVEVAEDLSARNSATYHVVNLSDGSVTASFKGGKPALGLTEEKAAGCERASSRPGFCRRWSCGSPAACDVLRFASDDRLFREAQAANRWGPESVP